jgi:hypothetical protein
MRQLLRPLAFTPGAGPALTPHPGPALAPQVKLVDLGMAGVYRAWAKERGCMGSPGFMAPEVIRGEAHTVGGARSTRPLLLVLAEHALCCWCWQSMRCAAGAGRACAVLLVLAEHALCCKHSVRVHTSATRSDCLCAGAIL